MALPSYARPTFSSRNKAVPPQGSHTGVSGQNTALLSWPISSSGQLRSRLVSDDTTAGDDDMKRFDCTTCDRSLPSAQFPKAPEGSKCEHDRGTCRRCWHQWLESQVASKRFDEMSCAQCSNLLDQNEIRALATPAVYQRYLDAEFKATMSGDSDFRWCLSPACQSGQIHSEGDIFRCASCGSKACVNCNVTWHSEETCEAFQTRAKGQPEEEEESAKAIRKYTKLCPGCNRKVEKRGGCDHIHCTMCSHDFCWLCLADYRQIGLEGNSAHKSSCQHWRAAPTPARA